MKTKDGYSYARDLMYRKSRIELEDNKWGIYDDPIIMNYIELSPGQLMFKKKYGYDSFQNMNLTNEQDYIYYYNFNL